MTAISRLWNHQWPPRTPLALYRYLTAVLAALMLAMILIFTLLLWPVSDLGLAVVDPRSATIAFVVPGSSAARAGLQVGDRVLQVYGLSWDAMIASPNMLPLIGPRTRPVPITVERAGAIYRYTLVQDAPSRAFQIAKLTYVLLTLFCWVTGYRLGLIQRHQPAGSPLVAWFWLLLSGVLSAYVFARSLSYPLRLLLDWFMLAILVPLAVYIHVWFPARPVPPRLARVARRTLIGSWVLLNVALFVGLLVGRPTLSELTIGLSRSLLISLLLGLSGSALILSRAYRRTTVAHLRRQIRLIALACYFVAVAWLFLLVLPSFVSGETLIADQWIDGLIGAVPLAYLVGAVAPDLYRLDRLLLRLSVHAGTTLVLTGLLAALSAMLALPGTTAILWGVLAFVVLYRPVQRLGFRLVPAHANPFHNTYEPLHRAMTGLTMTLDAPTLVDTLGTGVRATFGAPPLAFYAGDSTGMGTLQCVLRERLPQIPATLAPGALTDQLCKLPPVTEGRALHAALASAALRPDEAHLLHHPGLALWCPIHDTRGALLGLLVLGMRGDLDPYRLEDVRELGRMLDAAALAFGHSAAYAEQCAAEATIRQLYQRLLVAQDLTAAAIARELHDEIINVNLRLNIEALQKLIPEVPALRPELELVLDGERTTVQALRMICEDLHPSGIDDPLGLAAVLRVQLERLLALWAGEWELVIEGAPRPVAARTQYEALRITREALTNALKHAAATAIVVQLRYPEQVGGSAQLIVRDNGRGAQPITPRPGHWGVRNMIERARAVGGTLDFCRADGGGTAVVFTFPVATAGEDR